MILNGLKISDGIDMDKIKKKSHRLARYTDALRIYALWHYAFVIAFFSFIFRYHQLLIISVIAIIIITIYFIR